MGNCSIAVFLSCQHWTSISHISGEFTWYMVLHHHPKLSSIIAMHKWLHLSVCVYSTKNILWWNVLHKQWCQLRLYILYFIFHIRLVQPCFSKTQHNVIFKAPFRSAFDWRVQSTVCLSKILVQNQKCWHIPVKRTR